MHDSFTHNDSMPDCSFYSQTPRLYLREEYIIPPGRPGSGAGTGPDRARTPLGHVHAQLVTDTVLGKEGVHRAGYRAV